MNTGKFLVFAALGVAAAILLTSDKTEDLRADLADNAGKWRDKLKKLAGNTTDELSNLKDMVSKEIEGLGDDARDRIMNILNEGTKSARSVKGKVSNLS